MTDPRTRTSRGLRLGVSLLAVALALAACGGSDDPADVAGLPVADEAPDDGTTGEVPAPSAMCVEDEPDCQDMIVADGDDPTAGGAAGSCLVGDEDCTDESYDGQDVARRVPLADEPSGAEPAAFGATSGATGHRIQHAYLVAPDTLELTIGDNPCMLVEDVLVEESPAEVRVLVLAGQDAGVDGCIEPYVEFSLEIDLAAPLGDRALLDLAD